MDICIIIMTTSYRSRGYSCIYIYIPQVARGQEV